MADSKLTALTENTDPLGSDLEYMVDDPAGTPASRKVYMGSKNLLPDGYMINGKISVTVATNDITVALKTKSGGNPSATDPVSIWINGTMRRCTAALTVTKVDATNWFNAGATETATLVTPFFVYLIWNTTPATDIMDIGFARIPYGRVYSDFSGTTTNEKYLGFANASTPTSTDNVVNVGYFDATLSGTATFTWSVPTFTNANKIDVPTYESGWYTYVPTIVGFSANPTNTVYQYRIVGKEIWIRVRQATNGTSNATNFTMSVPFTPQTLTNMTWAGVAHTVVDNTVIATALGQATIGSAGTSISVQRDGAATAWTNSGGKRVGVFELRFPIAA